MARLADRTHSLGTLTVTGGRVVVGDAYYPPRGTVITAFPNGRFAVEGIISQLDGTERIAAFSVQCGEGGAESEVVDFSIDGGVVALADPAVQRPQSFLRRWRLRREVEKQMMRGLRGVPPGLYVDSLADSTGRTWAVVFHVGDGIYDVRVWRRDGSVTRLHCTLNSK